METGHDDFIYGNYVDWDTFRDQEEENLLAYFDVLLPWGKELTISEYLNFVSQEVFIFAPHIIEAFNILELPISKTDTNLSEIRIQFPDKKSIEYDFIISEIFDVYEVPSRTAFEHDLPENLQYWTSMIGDGLNEYDYYKRFPFEFSTYIGTLSNIRSKINNISDI